MAGIGLIMHRIDPQLVNLAVDMVELTPDPRNARTHDERNIVAVMDSYRDHGQRKPIVVQRVADNGTRMVVRAGNGQVEAAKRLGWTQIAAVVIDEKDREAIRYAYRDNRSAELAEWDYQIIAEDMAVFEHDGADFTALGWTTEEVAPLRETTWFENAKGDLEGHKREKDEDKDDKTKTLIKLTPEESIDLVAAADVMRSNFGEPGMTLAKVISRLARHYLATLTHSAAVKN